VPDEVLLEPLLRLSRALLVEGPERWPQLIDETLAFVGARLGADRAYLFEQRHGRLFNTKEWCAAGVESQIQNLQDVDPADFDTFMDPLRKAEVLHIPSVEDLPPGDRSREVLLAQGIHCLFAAPLIVGSRLLGFLGLDNPNPARVNSAKVLLGFLADLVATTAERRAHLDAIEAERARLAVLLQGAAASIYLVALDGMRVEQVSESFQQVLGYRPEEALGHDFWVERLHPADRDRILKGIPALFQTGSLLHEYRFRHADGTWRWLRDELHLSGAPGVASHAIGASFDITDRVAGEQRLESLSRIQAMIGAVSQAFVQHHDTSGAARDALGAIVEHLGARRAWIHLPSSSPAMHAFPGEVPWTEATAEKVAAAMTGVGVVLLATPNTDHAVRALLAADRCWCVALEPGDGLLVIEEPSEQAIPDQELAGLLTVLGEVMAGGFRRRRDLLSFFDQAPQAMLVVSRSTCQVVRANARACTLFAAFDGSLPGLPVEVLLPALVQDREDRDGYSGEMFGRPMPGTRTVVAKRLDGAELEIEVGISTVDDVILVGLLDVTARQQVLHRLERSVAQQQILLQEVHHRVKNNLQIVSSLLQMQLAAATEPVAVAAMRDSALRIQAMAMVHQSLHQDGSLSTVELGDYLARITQGVRRSLAVASPIAFEADRIQVPIDLAVPLGLIVNELLTNAIKHAGAAGIGVELRQDRDQMTLVVTDAGPGFAPEQLHRPVTLGLRMVRALARQAGAAFEYGHVGGSRFALSLQLRPSQLGG
jgi:PAS domain S-box-containing protein